MHLSFGTGSLYLMDSKNQKWEGYQIYIAPNILLEAIIYINNNAIKKSNFLHTSK